MFADELLFWVNLVRTGDGRVLRHHQAARGQKGHGSLGVDRVQPDSLAQELRVQRPAQVPPADRCPTVRAKHAVTIRTPCSVLANTFHCRGSTAIIPWLKYRNKAPGALPPRLYWIASVESARTAGQLATCARILDSVIRWEAVKRPAAEAETPFASATVRSKRLQPDGATWEFLVEYTPEEGSEEDGGLQTFVEWLPEQALPLWLIKTYEEKYRRDGVVPIRGRGAAAAAAVADACGACAAVYADDKDSSWVACDTCNKWFHCACVGIEQVRLELFLYNCPTLC